MSSVMQVNNKYKNYIIIRIISKLFYLIEYNIHAESESNFHLLIRY
jgi:hypothetical protein